MVACRTKDEENILHKHNLIILPQLYETEVLFRSHIKWSLARIKERLREMGECMHGMSTGERPKEDEVPTQVR